MCLSTNESYSEDEEYVVIGNAGQGRQNAWPKSEKPGVYSKKRAESIAKKQNERSGFGHIQIHFHVKPLRDALKHVNSGNAAYNGFRDLLDDRNIDTYESVMTFRDYLLNEGGMDYLWKGKQAPDIGPADSVMTPDGAGVVVDMKQNRDGHYSQVQVDVIDKGFVKWYDIFKVKPTKK